VWVDVYKKSVPITHARHILVCGASLHASCAGTNDSENGGTCWLAWARPSTKGATHMNGGRAVVEDEHDNVISGRHHMMQGAWTYDQYVSDCETSAELFREAHRLHAAVSEHEET